jgi:diguanylate cyclase (GGDEF)-like protein
VFSTAAVTSDQLHAMWQACSEIATEPDPGQASRRLAERLSQILAAPAVIYRREVSPWKLVSSAAPGGGGTPGPPKAGPLAGGFAAAGFQSIAGPNGTRWTIVPLDEGLPYQSILLLPGDWQTGAVADWLPRLATTASMALRLVAARHSVRLGDTQAALAYGFARRLTRISGHHLLHQYIVTAAARTANARLVSLSVYQPKEGRITVAATHGYSSEVVDDVRILPGAGIVGGVFSSRKPLLVRDTTRVPGLTPRSTRYQTTSFMALPIVAGRQAIGVLTLADRADGAPFTRDDLTATRLIAALSSLALAREHLAALSDELAQAAAVDPVTGLFNRRYLHSRLEAELERSRRIGMPVALVMLDVDGFKAVNDQHGHQAGDMVLRKVADVIKRSVRASDVCTRYGGDEFAIVVPENAASAAQTAGRIRQRVEKFPWDTLGLGQAVRVTLSAGFSIGEVGEPADSLIGRADQHLYQAKALGRNRVFPGAD